MQRRRSQFPSLVAGLLFLVAGVTCTDGPTNPKRALARLGLAPVLSQAATNIYRNLVALELTIDNIRVRLQRANGTIAIDTVVALPAGQDSVVLNLSLELEGNAEDFQATIDLRHGDEVLFSGTQTVTARAGINASSAPIPVEYAGPGATVTVLEVEPDTIISGLDDIQMRITARDANNQVVTNLALSWSIGDPRAPAASPLGTVTAGGLFEPSGARGIAVVTAELPTGVTGSASVTIVPPPSAVVVISGDAQTGVAGTALAAPFVVEVRAADNAPVVGHAVSFAVTSGGGSIAPTSAVTDADGRASATLTLGTTPGSHSVQVTADGLTPISFAATGIVGPAAKLAIAQQPASGTTSGAVLSTQPKVQLQDAFGNSVATANIAITAQLTTAEGRTLGGTTTRNTNDLGLAEFTDLMISGSTGTTTLTFTKEGLATVTSGGITLAAGVATSVSAVSALTMADSAGANVTTAQLPSVVVRDEAANPVSGVEVKFRRHGGVGATINAQPDTMVLVTTNVNGVASVSGRRLQTLIGFDTVLVSAAGLNDTLKFVATVTHANATQLAFVQQPPNGTLGIALSPATTVDVRDQFGNRVITGAGAATSVSLSLSGATLSGTTSVEAVAGLATFGNLIVSPAGSNYQLVAAATTLSGATSAGFSISSGVGTTRMWIAAHGEWSTAANWSGGVVPGASDTAVINQPGEYSVSISTPVSIGKVVVGGGTGAQLLMVTGSSGSLTVSDSVRVASNGILILGVGATGPVLTGGRVLINGIAEWVGGPIVGDHPIVVAEGASLLIAESTTTTLSRTLENHGLTIVVSSGPGSLVLSNGATIENSGHFDFQGEADISQGAGAAGAFLNFGTLRRSSDASTSSIAVPVANSGSVEAVVGTIAFTGATLTNTVTGVMRGSGAIDVSGTSFTNAGTLSPGASPGALTVMGSLPMQGTSRIVIELGGITAGGEYDQLNVTGQISPSGTLEISVLDGFIPVVGQTFTVLTFAGRSGTFGTITGLDLGGGLALVPVFSSTALTLEVQSTAAAVTWLNAVDGNWSDGTKWSTGVPPTSTDLVRIDVSGTYTVTLDADATIGTLLLGGASETQTLIATGRTLTVNNSLNVGARGVLGLVSVTVNGAGTITNQGGIVALSRSGTASAQATVVNTAFDNRGTLDAFGEILIAGQLVTNSASTIRVQGDIVAGPFGVLTITGGLTNNGLIELTNLTTTAPYGASLVTGTLINASGATVRSTGVREGPRSLAAQLTNLGTLDVDRDLTINSAHADHSNFGTIDLTSASLTVTQTGSTPSFANNSGGIIHIGSGRNLTVTGGTASNNSDATIRGTGTLNVSATTFGNAGIVAPGGTGATGELLLTGPYEQGASAVLAIELGGTSAGQFDLLSVSGVVTHGGTLNVTLVNGFVPTADDGFAIMTYSSGSGTIPNVNLPTLPAGLAWDVQYQAAGLVLVVENVGGVTVFWRDAISGNWSDGDKWSTGVPPTSTDIVGIELAGTYTVTLDVTPPTLAGLILGGTSGVQTLTGTGINLPFNGTLSIRTNGVLSLSSANLAGTGTALNEGTLRLTGISVFASTILDNRGTLILRGTTMINGQLLTTSSSDILIEGSSAGAAAQVTVASGFTNSGSLELRSVDAVFAANLTVSAGTLTNAPGASIVSSAGSGGGGGRQLTAQLVNEGALIVAHSMNIGQTGAVQVNNGSIDVTTGDLTISAPLGSFVNNNSITIAAGRVVALASGPIDLTPGIVTGEATGRLVLISATLTFTPEDVLVPLTLTSTSVAGNAISIGAGETLTLFAGNVSAGTTVTVQNGGTLVAVSNVSMTGALSVEAGAMVRVGGHALGTASSLTVGNGFTNNGTIELTSAVNALSSTLTVNNGTLTNGTTGIIRSLEGTAGARALAAQLNNQGVLDVEWPLTLSRASAAHTNSGTIDLTAANLTITQSGTTPSFANNGTIDIGAGRTFQVTGGVLTNSSSGVMNGTGTLDVASSIFTNNGSVAPGGTDAAGTLTVTGAYNQSATGSLAIELPGTSQFDVLTISGAASLAGTLNVTLLDGFAPALDNTFLVVTSAGASVGSFALNLPTLTTGLQWDVDFETNGVRLTVVAGTTTVSWISASDGNWSDGANWSTGVPPTSTEVVNIVTAGTYTVTLDVHATVAGLNIGGASGAQILTAFDRGLTVDGPATIGANGALSLISAALAVSATLTNHGLLQMSGGNHAQLTVGGTLTNASDGTIQTLGTSGVRIVNATLANEGTLDVDHQMQLTGANHVNSGVIDMAANITVQGGTFTNTSTGVFRGAGIFFGVALTNNGTISPGTSAPSVGVLNIGGVTQGPNGVVNIKLGGLGAGTGHDQLLTGDAVFDGTINVTAINGFVPVPGNSFTIVTYDSRTGSVVVNPPEISGVEWEVTHGPTSIVLSVPLSFASVSPGGSHTCGLNASGAAFCWGLNDNGQLGTGSQTNSSLPIAVSGGLAFSSIVAGGEHTCALTSSGAAYCWGHNNFDQLGTGTSGGRSTTPVPVSGGHSFTALSFGFYNTCGFKGDGTVFCWGYNFYGQLGDGSFTNRNTPVAVVGGLTFASFSGGGYHNCGLTSTGAAHCWGRNAFFQLGIGGTAMDSIATPVAVTGGLTFASLAAGGHHTCALDTDGAAQCWGRNVNHQLGDGGTTNSSTPVAVTGGLSFTTLTSGGHHSCALNAAGGGYCWGYNFDGELGNGSNTESGSPVAVSGGVTFATLRAGEFHNCGQSTSGGTHCWGFNGSGRIGDGTTTARNMPVLIASP